MGKPEGQPRLVLIEWEDTSLPTPHWQWITDLKETAEVRCRTVGFLLREERHYVVLGMTLGSVRGAMQVSGVFSIPKRCVIEITPLSPSYAAAADFRDDERLRPSAA